ncbi:hypothetical protein BC826DRAFT_1107423 [Russula brevipes]|nr:hypothetical protein BC826DRAFT_1107423 [Russula brevipes]
MPMLVPLKLAPDRRIIDELLVLVPAHRHEPLQLCRSPSAARWHKRMRPMPMPVPLKLAPDRHIIDGLLVLVPARRHEPLQLRRSPSGARLRASKTSQNSASSDGTNSRTSPRSAPPLPSMAQCRLRVAREHERREEVRREVRDDEHYGQVAQLERDVHAEGIR